MPKPPALLLLLCSVQLAASANILAAVFTPSYSHQLAFQPIWRELHRRGHHLTLLTTNPMRDPSLANLTELDLSASYDVLRRHNADAILSSNEESPLTRLRKYMDALHEVGETQLALPDVQRLLASGERFDLLLVEVIYPLHIAFAWHFKVPFIGLVSLEAPPRTHSVMGNPVHPALYPDYGLPFDQNLNFFERLASTAYYLLMEWYASYRLYPTTDLTVKKFFGDGVPPLKEIEQNMSFLFSTMNPVLAPVRPLVPNTIQIGGGMHLSPPKELPVDIKQFLDGGSNGVVYFSLGSNVKSASLPNVTKSVIVEAFRKLPYKVIWKFEDQTLKDIPSNVKMVDWVPQTSVLAHPNVKAFVTQGGLQSIEEAMFYYVPMVGLPFYGDQFKNTQLLWRKGLGLKLSSNSLKSEELAEAIGEVIKNEMYRENLRKIVELMNDEEMTGLEKAVWWTEYAIRHKGAEHLRCQGRNLPLYQYFMLDVIGFVVGVVAVFGFCFVKLCSCCCGRKKSKAKQE